MTLASFRLLPALPLLALVAAPLAVADGPGEFVMLAGWPGHLSITTVATFTSCSLSGAMLEIAPSPVESRAWQPLGPFTRFSARGPSNGALASFHYEALYDARGELVSASGQLRGAPIVAVPDAAGGSCPPTPGSGSGNAS